MFGNSFCFNFDSIFHSLWVKSSLVLCFVYKIFWMCFANKKSILGSYSWLDFAQTAHRKEGLLHCLLQVYLTFALHWIYIYFIGFFVHLFCLLIFCHTLVVHYISVYVSVVHNNMSLAQDNWEVYYFMYTKAHSFSSYMHYSIPRLPKSTIF